MATLGEITDRLRAAVEAGEPIASSIRLDLEGEGSIRIDRRSVSNDDAAADLVITLTKADLEAMGRGRLAPMTAVVTGRMKLSDPGLAMRLQPDLQALFRRVR